MRWALLVLLAITGNASASCLPVLERADAAEDVTLLGATDADAASPPPSIDLRSLRLEVTDGIVNFATTLGAAPEFGSLTFLNRYWLGFTLHAEGKLQYMDLRVGATNTYHEGSLISSNEHGNQRLATVPLAWNGTTMSFSFPVSLLLDEYGPFEIGGPEAQADGRSLTTQAQGFTTGAVFVDYFFAAGAEPFACQEPVAATGELATAAARESPAPSFVLLLALAVLACMARRQAY